MLSLDRLAKSKRAAAFVAALFLQFASLSRSRDQGDTHPVRGSQCRGAARGRIVAHETRQSAVATIDRNVEGVRVSRIRVCLQKAQYKEPARIRERADGRPRS